MASHVARRSSSLLGAAGNSIFFILFIKSHSLSKRDLWKEFVPVPRLFGEPILILKAVLCSSMFVVYLCSFLIVFEGCLVMHLPNPVPHKWASENGLAPQISTLILLLQKKVILPCGCGIWGYWIGSVNGHLFFQGRYFIVSFVLLFMIFFVHKHINGLMILSWKHILNIYVGLHCQKTKISHHKPYLSLIWSRWSLMPSHSWCRHQRICDSNSVTIDKYAFYLWCNTCKSNILSTNAETDGCELFPNTLELQEQISISGVCSVPFEGTQVNFLSPEAIIAVKLMWFRDQDRSDILNIFRQCLTK